MAEIIIEIKGGLVHNTVTGLPKGYELKVIDHDLKKDGLPHIFVMGNNPEMSTTTEQRESENGNTNETEIKY